MITIVGIEINRNSSLASASVRDGHEGGLGAVVWNVVKGTSDYLAGNRLDDVEDHGMKRLFDLRCDEIVLNVGGDDLKDLCEVHRILAEQNGARAVF